MGATTEKKKALGLLAEFDNPQALVEAADKARREGFKRMEGYSPFPVEGLREALGQPRTRMPILIFLGGITGTMTGFLLQTLTSGGLPPEWDQWIPFNQWFSYRLNIAGRPFFSWQAFVPPMFEMTILFASFAAVFGMLARNGYPCLHHPLFEVPEFSRASVDRFFLCIEAADRLYDDEKTREFLTKFKPLSISEVPA